MRLKTMLLGTLVAPMALGLSSGRKISDAPDKGFNPGEAVPSIVVDGCDLGEALASMPSAVLVVWSVADAPSRVANVWASNSMALSDAGTPVISLCVDGDDVTAKLYAMVDGAKASVVPVGLQGRKLGKWLLSTSFRPGNVYYTSYGVVDRVLSAERLLASIQ